MPRRNVETHGLQALPRGPGVRDGSRASLGRLTAREPGGQLEIVIPPQQHAACGLPVPPGATGLLVVRLGARGDTHVDHQPHVWLVDPHAESGGGHHHPDLRVQEPLEERTARRSWEPGVIGRCAESLPTQDFGDPVGAVLGGHVHDGAALGHPAEQGDQRAEACRFTLQAGHREVEIGPVERCHDQDRPPKAQHGADVRSGLWRGRRGERDRRRAAQGAP